MSPCKFPDPLIVFQKLSLQISVFVVRVWYQLVGIPNKQPHVVEVAVPVAIVSITPPHPPRLQALPSPSIMASSALLLMVMVASLLLHPLEESRVDHVPRRHVLLGALGHARLLGVSEGRARLGDAHGEAVFAHFLFLEGYSS